MNVSLLSTLDRANEVITFALSAAAQSLLGTDDATLVAEAYPSLKFVQRSGKQEIFTATREDERTILFDLNERSIIEAGFCHTAAERAVARRHAVKLYAQLYGGAR
jgi:hypothetical protein